MIKKLTKEKVERGGKEGGEKVERGGKEGAEKAL